MAAVLIAARRDLVRLHLQRRNEGLHHGERDRRSRDSDGCWRRDQLPRYISLGATEVGGGTCPLFDLTPTAFAVSAGTTLLRSRSDFDVRSNLCFDTSGWEDPLSGFCGA